MIWVIVANSSLCRIYTYQKNHSELKLIKNFQDGDARLKDSELVSDRPGHYAAGAVSGRGAYSPETDPKMNEINIFARKIADEVESGRKTGLFDELIIISPAKMDGLLAQHLSTQSKDKIINTIHKDIPHTTDRELVDFLHTHAQYRDIS